MKYKLNENPDGILVPVIERKDKLLNEEDRFLTTIGIYPDATAFYFSDFGQQSYLGLESINLGQRLFMHSLKLAEWPDEDLHFLEKSLGIPVGEIKEIRDIERDYRNRKSSQTTSVNA